jgi:hypothetical protein
MNKMNRSFDDILPIFLAIEKANPSVLLLGSYYVNIICVSASHPLSLSLGHNLSVLGMRVKRVNDKFTIDFEP